ncbi:histidine kinase [Altericista sp. CCNU0014]|uniref:histidine kinase n=1 Tax=Altericista sp. CCNU0014 TaxID=3082949 RepID=UPI00384A6D2E
MDPLHEYSSELVFETDSSLQLLLFIDKRSSSKEQLRQVQDYLETLRETCAFELQIIDIEDQPYLAEYFKLVITPALIKILPEPRHILAGNNLVAQLAECWPNWQHAMAMAETRPTSQNVLAQSVQAMRLSDEIFQLRQENEALQEQGNFKDRIIAMLAHDLRNPLTAAAIALETLEGQWEPSNSGQMVLPPETMARLAHHARSQMQVIERMITNLLDASRGRSSELKISPRKLDLGALCPLIIETLQPKAEAKTQHLKIDVPPDLPYVHADSDHIRQVLMNLLDNAIKYTPEGGVIKFCILHRTTQKVQISISDDGPGIPLEKQKAIFYDAFRLERDELKEGYGIGLALCQRIIRAHYGQIWVDSTPNEGSSFNFTLPVYRS